METGMYKKQMILQRIVCYAMLAASALVFIYSLGIMTDMANSNFAFFYDWEVAGTEIYFDMQEFNKDFTFASLILILLAVSQFLFQNHKRRKYYIANYITVVANTVAAVMVSNWALDNIFTYRKQYLEVDFEQMEFWIEQLGDMYYTDSTFWFDISKPIFTILLVVAALNVINLIFKTVVMIAERRLLKKSEEV